MRISFAGLAGLSFAVLLGSVSIPNAAGQGKAEKAQKTENIQGVVQTIGKGTSTITVRVGTASRQVVYKADTKFLYGHSDSNKPGSLAQVKESFYISCAGTFDGKAQLVAQTCIYRETK